jgi:[methyl-Co(III) methanol-specific corrinoid protein]:coenzyme M methyltransferase
MNTKQEIIDAIEGRFEGELPPPVLFTQTGTRDQMRYCGASWPEAHRDTEKMVKLALQPSERFGFATVRLPFDVSVEAEAVGCSVNEGTEINQPAITGSPWRDTMTIPTAADLPSVDEFMSCKRIRTILESAERIGREKEDLFRTTMCTSSSAMPMHMLGMEGLIMSTITDPDSVKRLIDHVTPFSIAYASELSEVSDNVMIITGALSGIFTPEFVRYTIKRDEKVIRAMKNSFSTIHNCGDTYDYVDDLVAMRPDVISLETSSRPDAFLRKIGMRCKTLGCISPVNVLLPGSPEEVRAEALRSAKLGFDLVGPECGVPPITPDANLKARAHYRL